jgi:transposase
MSDYKGAALMVDALPQAKALLGDKGYDADWFRQALIERGITPCIPPKSNRKHPSAFDRELYRSRHKIENMFGKLKDWRRIHTRYVGSIAFSDLSWSEKQASERPRAAGLPGVSLRGV